MYQQRQPANFGTINRIRSAKSASVQSAAKLNRYSALNSRTLSAFDGRHQQDDADMCTMDDILNSVDCIESMQKISAPLSSLNVSGKNTTSSARNFSRPATSAGGYTMESRYRPRSAKHKTMSRRQQKQRPKTAGIHYMDKFLVFHFADGLTESSDAVAEADRLVDEHRQAEKESLKSGLCAQWISSRSKLCQSTAVWKQRIETLASAVQHMDVNSPDVRIGINGMSSRQEQQSELQSLDDEKFGRIPLSWSDQLTKPNARILTPRQGKVEQTAMQPVVFNSSRPRDALRQYVIEVIQRQNNQSAILSTPDQSQTAVRNEDADGNYHQYLLRCQSARAATPNAASLPEPELLSSRRVDFDINGTRPIASAANEVKRPSTARVGRLLVPVVPQCSLPVNQTGTSGMKIVGRATCLSARSSGRMSRAGTSTAGSGDCAVSVEDVKTETKPVDESDVLISDLDEIEVPSYHPTGYEEPKPVDLRTGWSQSLGPPYNMVVANDDRMDSRDSKPLLTAPVPPGDRAIVAKTIRPSSRPPSRLSMHGRQPAPSSVGGGGGNVAGNTDFMIITSKNSSPDESAVQAKKNSEKSGDEILSNGDTAGGQDVNVPEVVDPAVRLSPAKKTLIVPIPTEHGYSQQKSAAPPPSRAESPDAAINTD